MPESWRAALRRGLEKLRKGDFDAAETQFSRAYQLAPMQPEVCYALGREHLRRGRIAEGERLLHTAWASDRSLVSAAASLARSMAQNGARFEAAHELLADAELDGHSADVLLVVRAEIYVDQQRMADARTAASQALHQTTSEATRRAARAVLARVHNTEGIDHARAGDYDRALFCFKRAADHDPDWSSPHVNEGACFSSLGKLNRAVASYERAIAIEPDDCDAWVDLGATLWASGDRDRAETCYRQALDLNPEHENACTRLADLLARDARYLEAAMLAERASEIADRKRRRP